MKNIVLAEVIENEELQKEYFYNKGWRHKMLEPLTIKVFAPYEIMEHEGKKYIISSSYIKLFQKGYSNGIGGKISHSVYPFDVKKLIFDVLKININDKKSILEFCDKYGVLGEVRTKHGVGSSIPVLSTINLNMCGTYESLDYFIENVKKIQECFNLYIIIDTKNKPELTKWWVNMIDEALEYIEIDLKKAIKNKHQAFIEFNQEAKTEHIKLKENIPSLDTIIESATRELLDEMNNKLTYTFLNLRVDSNGNFIEGIATSTLIGAIYYQLYNHIIKGDDFKVCKYCGSYFIPRKIDTLFCPSEEPNKHGECQNRYNAMVRRIREWHFKQGLSIEEIQGKIKKPRRLKLDEIQECIDSYNGTLK